MEVSCFTKYGRSAASTRQRVLQYLPALEAAGIHVTNHSLLPDEYVQSLATGDRFPSGEIAKSYLRRMRQVLQTKCDAIWVYAELFPYLPALFERFVFLSHKPVVYDMDDAFFHTYDSAANWETRALLGGKLKPLLRGASVVCCGNAYLQDYAKELCRRSIILPTVVDTDVYRLSALTEGNRPVTIGWIGSPTTWPYVQPLLPMLRDLCRELGAAFRVVGAGASAAEDVFPGMQLLDWSEASEVEDVQNMDIGIMPLPDEQWARGKSGYKIVQYMACGLPVVASPVGVNREMVRSSIDGFLAETEAEWREALATLIEGAELRRKMGASGRHRAVQFYSLQSQAPKLVSLFQSLAK